MSTITENFILLGLMAIPMLSQVVEGATGPGNRTVGTQKVSATTMSTANARGYVGAEVCKTSHEHVDNNWKETSA